MIACHVLREELIKRGCELYMVYRLEDGDPPANWLHEGLSHAVIEVFQHTYPDVLRPYKTACGIVVSERVDRDTYKLFNLVKVATTCLWCMSGMEKES